MLKTDAAVTPCRARAYSFDDLFTRLQQHLTCLE